VVTGGGWWHYKRKATGTTEVSESSNVICCEDMADAFGGLFFDQIPVEISHKIQNKSHFLQA